MHLLANLAKKATLLVHLANYLASNVVWDLFQMLLELQFALLALLELILPQQEVLHVHHVQ